MSLMDALIFGYRKIRDAVDEVAMRDTIQFVGATVADDDFKKRTVVTIPSAGSAYATIQDNGAPVAQSATLNVVGATVEDIEGVTLLTIPSFPTGSAGDVAYHNGTAWVTLSPGTEGQTLTIGVALLPEWAAATGWNPVGTNEGDVLQWDGSAWVNVNVILPAYGGTGLNAYTVGDTLYASGEETLTPLAIGPAGTSLASTGSAPEWAYPTTLLNAAGAVVVNTSVGTRQTVNWLVGTDAKVKELLIALVAAGIIDGSELAA